MAVKVGTTDNRGNVLLLKDLRYQLGLPITCPETALEAAFRMQALGLESHDFKKRAVFGSGFLCSKRTLEIQNMLVDNIFGEITIPKTARACQDLSKGPR